MKMSREQKHLQFKEHKIELFQDLPHEVLTKRWKMREITKHLIEAKIHYKWNGAVTLSVFFKRHISGIKCISRLGSAIKTGSGVHGGGS